jgi:phage major head subunit gpT-like protein
MTVCPSSPPRTPVNIDVAGSPTQANRFTSTALTADNWNAVRTAFSQFKTDAGRVTGWFPDTLIVPPQLERTALEIVKSTMTVKTVGSSFAAVDNQLKGTAEVLVIPELGTDATTWYPAVTKQPVKPLIWQERQPPNMVPLVDPQSKNVFFDKEFIWGVDARGAAAYGLWFLMARCEA